MPGTFFVAEWGEYLSHRFGRRVVRVRLGANGRSGRVTTFADGFAHPLALLVDTGTAACSSPIGDPASSTGSRPDDGLRGKLGVPSRA